MLNVVLVGLVRDIWSTELRPVDMESHKYCAWICGDRKKIICNTSVANC